MQAALGRNPPGRSFCERSSWFFFTILRKTELSQLPSWTICRMSSLASSSVFARLPAKRMSELGTALRLRGSFEAPGLTLLIRLVTKVVPRPLHTPDTKDFKAAVRVATLAFSCAFATDEVLNHKRQHRGKVDVQGWLVQVLVLSAPHCPPPATELPLGPRAHLVSVTLGCTRRGTFGKLPPHPTKI